MDNKCTFSLGENSERRTYNCTLLDPLKATDFGVEIACEVASLFDLDVVSKLTSEVNSNLSNEQNQRIATAMLFSSFGKLNPKSLSEKYKYLKDNTIIIAVENGQTREYFLNDDKQYNEWFQKHPSDIFEVMIRVISNNVTFFLPSWLKGIIKMATGMPQTKPII